jgi:hypothetical protein
MLLNSEREIKRRSYEYGKLRPNGYCVFLKHERSQDKNVTGEVGKCCETTGESNVTINMNYG